QRRGGQQRTQLATTAAVGADAAAHRVAGIIACAHPILDARDAGCVTGVAGIRRIVEAVGAAAVEILILDGAARAQDHRRRRAVAPADLPAPPVYVTGDDDGP